MSYLGGYGNNVLVAVEEIEDGLGSIKMVGEVMIFCDHVFLFDVAMVGV